MTTSRSRSRRASSSHASRRCCGGPSRGSTRRSSRCATSSCSATHARYSQQADLLAKRERVALLPLAHLESLRPFLVRQHERLVVAPLGRPSRYLPSGRAGSGTVSVDGKRWFYAARPVARKALVLLRPRGTRAWRPYLEGLFAAAGIGLALAAV